MRSEREPTPILKLYPLRVGTACDSAGSRSSMRTRDERRRRTQEKIRAAAERMWGRPSRTSVVNDQARADRRRPRFSGSARSPRRWATAKQLSVPPITAGPFTAGMGTAVPAGSSAAGAPGPSYAPVGSDRLKHDRGCRGANPGDIVRRGIASESSGTVSWSGSESWVALGSFFEEGCPEAGVRVFALRV